MQKITDALTGRAGLAGVQALLLGQTARQALRASLAGLLAPGYQLGACRLQRAKFKPGRKLTAYFDVQVLSEQGIAQTRPLVVTWSVSPTPSEAHGEPSTLEQEAFAYDLAAPFRRLMAAQLDWQMQIQLAPLDHRFPQVMRLYTPAYVMAWLHTVKPEVAVGEVRVKPIRYRPGQRHVLAYTCPTGQGQQVYFAKLYPGEEGASFAQTARWIADQLDTSPVPVRALCPLTYRAADNVILYPQVAGVTLADHLRRPTRRTASYLHSVGQALRHLHSAQPPCHILLPGRDLPGESKAVLRTSEHIQCLLPAVGRQLEELLHHTAAALAALPAEPATFVHGDLKADHLFLQPTGLILFDFDACALADPAVDVGKFLADLCWWYNLYRDSGMQQAQAAFLQGYGLPAHHPRLQRAWHYAVIALLKMTAHRVPLFAPDWATRTHQMIEQSRALNARYSPHN